MWNLSGCHLVLILLRAGTSLCVRSRAGSLGRLRFSIHFRQLSLDQAWTVRSSTRYQHMLPCVTAHWSSFLCYPSLCCLLKSGPLWRCGLFLYRSNKSNTCFLHRRLDRISVSVLSLCAALLTAVPLLDQIFWSTSPMNSNNRRIRIWCNLRQKETRIYCNRQLTYEDAVARSEPC